jgi:hypothetical protein
MRKRHLGTYLLLAAMAMLTFSVEISHTGVALSMLLDDDDFGCHDCNIVVKQLRHDHELCRT